MNRVGPVSAGGREELEDLWRLKLEGANQRFQVAAAHYTRLLGETPEILAPDRDGPLARARQARSEAQAEYARLLKIFTDLTITGRIPKESPVTSAEELP